MKNIICVVLIFLLSGCANMTPREKTVTLIAVGVIIGAAAISSGGSVEEESCGWSVGPNGSTRFCR